MADPFTAIGLAALSVLGSVQQAAAANASAEQARAAAAAAAEDRRRQGRRELARIATGAAARGALEGSTLDVLGDHAGEVELAARRAIQQGEVQAFGFETRAAQALLGAGEPLLRLGGSVAGPAAPSAPASLSLAQAGAFDPGVGPGGLGFLRFGGPR